MDPNPRHCGKGFKILRRAGITVTQGVLAEACERLNEAFNHWIVRRTPLVTVKAGMTLDGKIATASGESRWITGPEARAYGMTLRQGSDAILVGINTVLLDNPSLTVRSQEAAGGSVSAVGHGHKLRRIVLDARGRTPLEAKVASDEYAALTTVVVNKLAPKRRVAALAKRVEVLVAPGDGGNINLRWLLKKLGSQDVTSLLVEGGGEVNASFLWQGLAQRVAFFYAPKILGGRESRRGLRARARKRWRKR
jgi:diaminohydroxyphosphoribosylaminopyrimidine deaminase/5-amino-6-(5-phosphoribosylamino)uracil reductase